MLQCSTSPLVLPHLKGWTVTSLGAQRLKRLPPRWETRVQSLGQEDSLEKEMVTHSSILAWRIPWTEKPGRLQSIGSQRVGHDWVTSFTYLLTYSHIWLVVIYWRLQLCTLRLIFLFSCFSFYFVETFQPDSLFFISYSPQIPNFVSYVCCAKSLQSCPTLCDPMDCM